MSRQQGGIITPGAPAQQGLPLVNIGGVLAIPVVLANPTPPSTDPFTAAINKAFEAKQVWLETFAFTAVFNTLAASASGQQATSTVDPSIDFLAYQMQLCAYSAAGTIVANPDYLLEVQEGSGRSNWSDGPVHVANWTSQNRDSAQAYNFPIPRYIRGNNTISFKLTNNTATAARVDIALIGTRITYLATSRQELFNIPQ